MKRSILLIALIIFCSCTKKFNPYHSTASLPYYSSTVKTKMRHIEGEDGEREKSDYGVFACIDSLNVRYLIIAPNVASGSLHMLDKPYNDYYLPHAICLMPAKAEELLHVVRNSISSWDEHSEKNDAIYYEYSLAPESEIKHVSENVVQWNPTLKYWYQVNSSGSLSYLIIGEGTFKKKIEFDKLSHVQELEYLLARGLDEMRRM